MKFIPCLLSALVLLNAEAALAQETNVTKKPSHSHSHKASAKPAEPAKKPEPFTEERSFDPPGTATVKDNLNVRGQPAFIGEVVAHLHKGDTVSVLETMTVRKPKKDEPAHWARIALPTNTPVWIFAEYVNAKTLTVTRKRVNFRGGPGENYSVLGRLKKGDVVEEVRRKSGWIQIKTPANAYAFVDSEYLDISEGQPAPPPVLAETKTAPPEPVPAPVVTPAPAPVATPPPTPAPQPETAATPPPPTPTPTPSPVPDNTPPPATTPTPAPSPAIVAPEPSAAAPLPERIITREGILKRTYNIQAPTDYELRDLATGEVLDFVDPPPKQKMKGYVGLRVVVTGPEEIDPRWTKVPVLEAQSLDAVP